MTSTTQDSRASATGEVFETEFIRIVYQKGFLHDVGVNGCRVEHVIDALIEKLVSYENGTLACQENQWALRDLRHAKAALASRLERRREQGVLDTPYQHATIRTEDEDHDFSATGA